MGHYYSEMHSDYETEGERRIRIQAEQERKKKIEKVGKILKISPKEVDELIELLQDLRIFKRY